MRRVSGKGQEGLTLIELIVTLSIMGIAFVVVISGMFTSVVVSDVHRKQATANTLLRSLAESVKDAPYNGDDVTCGYQAVVQAAVPLQDRDEYVPTAVCTPLEPKLQRIKLEVRASNGRATETVEIVKRQA